MSPNPQTPANPAPPIQKPKKRSHPANPFILYFQDMFNKYGGNMYRTARECGRRWKILPQSEKDKYKRMYIANRARYNQQAPATTGYQYYRRNRVWPKVARRTVKPSKKQLALQAQQALQAAQAAQAALAQAQAMAPPVGQVQPAPQVQAPAAQPVPQIQAPAVQPVPQIQAPAVQPAPQIQAPAVQPAPQIQAPAVQPAPQIQAPAALPATQQPPAQNQTAPVVKPPAQNQTGGTGQVANQVQGAAAPQPATTKSA